MKKEMDEIKSTMKEKTTKKRMKERKNKGAIIVCVYI